jgi:uncharacterized membrane protein YbaN (DUF454 family)
MAEKIGEAGAEIWKFAKKLVGVIFIVLGIAGLILPILNGTFLILIGLALYNNESVKQVILDFEEKFRQFREKYFVS